MLIDMVRYSPESIYQNFLHVFQSNNHLLDHLKKQKLLNSNQSFLIFSLPPSEAGLFQFSVTVLFVISLTSGCSGEAGGSIYKIR
jgi:hypothetical protein